MCENVTGASSSTASFQSVHGQNMILLRRLHTTPVVSAAPPLEIGMAVVTLYLLLRSRPRRYVLVEPKPRLRVLTGARREAIDSSPWSYHSPATRDENHRKN
jgi:hypothetical protein